MSITLKHGATTRTFSELSAKGFKPSDSHIQVVSRRVEFLDGSVRKKVLGFQRVFTLNLGSLTDSADLTFLGEFLDDEDQYISSYTWAGTGGDITETDLRVVDLHEDFASDWRGAEIGRHIILRLREADYRIGFPSGAGYGFDYSGPYGTTL